ncbi:MAG: hypothetical protein KAS39_03720 [Actinomycetia bacterium]|nr:hypothetical protein [Actinomycetes bacterium]
MYGVPWYVEFISYASAITQILFSIIVPIFLFLIWRNLRALSLEYSKVNEVAFVKKVEKKEDKKT